MSSGTSAIHLALIMLGVGKGDTVLTQSFTFAASAFPVAYQHATPVFIGSEKETWNMDPNALEDALKQINKSTHQQLPKAIIPVHLYGMPAKMDEIMAIAKQYNIPVIEDAAEGLGASYKNQKLGTFGDIGIYSFNGNKIITTSGGGALVSDNEDYVTKARFLATQARDNAPHYEHTQIGYNYRMSNISAGIGRGQMEVLNDHVKRRREIWQTYYNELNDIFEFQNPSDSDQQINKSTNQLLSNRWLTTIVTKSFEQREAIRLALEEQNIEARPLWKPMHLQPIFKAYPYYGDRLSEQLFEKGLCLPSGSNMTEEQLLRVINIIKSLF